MVSTDDLLQKLSWLMFSKLKSLNYNHFSMIIGFTTVYFNYLAWFIVITLMTPGLGGQIKLVLGARLAVWMIQWYRVRHLTWYLFS